MKDSIKKIVTAVCALAISSILMTGAVFAETEQPMPDSNTTTTTSVSDITTSSAETSGATQAPINNVVSNNSVASNANNVTQSSNESVSNKKYLSKLGGFLWFLLSVIVNFILSCWIGNRFYKLARRSAQGSGEIRALRKDIEEKFASTIKDISEPAIEVINQNENYSRTDEGLSMPERKQKIEINDEEREIFRRWDSQRSAGRNAARVREEREEEEYEDDYDDYDQERASRPAKRSYHPTRRSSGIEFEDEDDDYEDEDYDDYEERYSSRQRPARMSEHRTKSSKKNSNGINKAKGKAKDFLSNVFPFDE